jgi:hypothetical protein
MNEVDSEREGGYVLLCAIVFMSWWKNKFTPFAPGAVVGVCVPKTACVSLRRRVRLHEPVWGSVPKI